MSLRSKSGPERPFGRLNTALNRRQQPCRGTSLNLPSETACAARGGHQSAVAPWRRQVAISRHGGDSSGALWHRRAVRMRYA